MRRHLTEAQQKELDLLGQRMLLSIEFAENAQDFPGAKDLRAIVAAAIANHDLRTARLLNREVNDLMIGLAAHERDGLEALLRQRLGIDVEQERSNSRHQISQILKRGSIASEKERRRLEDYVESLEAAGADEAEIAAIRLLLRSP
jgi:hypothetical protein